MATLVELIAFGALVVLAISMWKLNKRYDFKPFEPIVKKKRYSNATV